MLTRRQLRKIIAETIKSSNILTEEENMNLVMYGEEGPDMIDKMLLSLEKLYNDYHTNSRKRQEYIDTLQDVLDALTLDYTAELPGGLDASKGAKAVIVGFSSEKEADDVIKILKSKGHDVSGMTTMPARSAFDEIKIVIE